nr:MAG TPA: hypothetical protein [Caudoviricetes sp.]
MRVIKRLSEQILDEVEGVEDYAKDALTWRGTDDKLSRTYHELAEAEYGHVQRLHDEVVRKVAEARESGVEVPQSMLDAWDERHRAIIERMHSARTFLDMW